MMTQKKPTTQALPNLWQTIAAGFDLTTKHLWLLLLPIALDSFFWLGPRLSILPLIRGMLAFSFPVPGVEATNEQLLELGSHLNVFALLSVPVMGVPALMAGFVAPEKTPILPFVWEINNYGVLFLLFGGLIVVGLLLTAVYFVLIAQTVRIDKLTPGQLLGRMGLTWLQFLALTAVFFVASCLIYTPIFPISLILLFQSPALASGFFSCGSVLLTWFAIYLAFVPHGLTLNGRPLLAAFPESVRLVQRHFLPSLSLLFAVLIVKRILYLILRLADGGNWLTFISILGHAFVTTSLVVATFIFYRDRFAPITNNP